jgi:enoyl-CoA hydratase/carnithine racemase
MRAVKELLQAAPNTRAEVKRLINARYGAIDEMTFEASLMSGEMQEGFAAFREKREPSWVPEAFREGKRL